MIGIPEWSFNRTIVELKLIRAEKRVSLVKGFNRTIVELKLASSAESNPSTTSFNRTIVELKYFIGTTDNIRKWVLIGLL